MYIFFINFKRKKTDVYVAVSDNRSMG